MTSIRLTFVYGCLLLIANSAQAVQYCGNLPKNSSAFFSCEALNQQERFEQDRKREASEAIEQDKKRELKEQLKQLLTENFPPPKKQISEPVPYNPVRKPDGISDYPFTDCVMDSATGLVWERKTSTGLRAMSNTYTNYGDMRSRDSSEYVARVNEMRLCGQTDWRLPTIDELKGLYQDRKLLRDAVEQSFSSDDQKAKKALRIHMDLFPNTELSSHWSSSPFPGKDGLIWSVDFNTGYALNNNHGYNSLHVILVRR